SCGPGSSLVEPKSLACGTQMVALFQLTQSHAVGLPTLVKFERDHRLPSYRRSLLVTEQEWGSVRLSAEK
ncbi:MAG: hypothetical protein WA699_18160, partial [Pseudolabrys sp.]